MIRVGSFLWFVLLPLSVCFSETPESGQPDLDVTPWFVIQEALEAAVNSDDDALARHMIEKARDAALALPDSVRIGFRYVSWRDGREGVVEDSTPVDVRWIKYALTGAAATDPLDTMRVRFLRDQWRAFMDSWNTVRLTVLEESDDPYADRIRAILGRPEFHETESRHVLSEALAKAIRWFFEWLKELFGNVRPEVETPVPPMDFSLVGKFLLYVLYAIGAVLLGWVMFRMWAHFRTPRRTIGEKTEQTLGGLLEAGETTEPDEHRLLAEQWAAEGDYRRAIRHLFLSALLHLDREHLVRYHRAWTNREFLEMVKGHEKAAVRGVADRLERLARTFDRKWYGLEAASVEDFRQCEEDRAVVMLASEKETPV